MTQSPLRHLFAPRCTSALLVAAIPIAALLPVATLRADEVRLADGRTLIGSVHEAQDGALHIMTASGTITVERTQVVRIRTDDELRAEVRDLESRVGTSAHARLELARRAGELGLRAERDRYLTEAITVRPRTDSMRRRIDAYLCSIQDSVWPRLPQLGLPANASAKRRATAATTRVRALLRRVPRAKTPVQKAVLRALLAAEPAADAALRRFARNATSPNQRMTALQGLRDRLRAAPAQHPVVDPGFDQGQVTAKPQASKKPGGGDLQFLWRTAIFDRNQSVRAAMVRDIVRRQESGAALDYLRAGLVHSSAPVRIRTAAAFASMRDPRALPMLAAAAPKIATLADSSPGAPRSHISITKQQAYIRDFDVEIASASFIADPKVDILQSGVVLDVAVRGVNTYRIAVRRAFRRAMHALAGADPGDDISRWAEFARAHTPTSAPAVLTGAPSGR